MSNYHVLFQDPDKKRVQVIFHVPVPPTGVNGAGIGWQSAVLLERQFSGQMGKSILPNISSGELALIDNGSLLEIQDYVQFTSTNLTDSQRNAQVLASYSSMSNVALSQKQITLNFMGYNSSP
jgi:hypothetical protein